MHTFVPVKTMTTTLTLLLSLVAWPQLSHANAQTPTPQAPMFENLGDHHHPITTASPLAQRYFDQGLIFAFAFNHAEAIRSFREASRVDPTCAMCFWGEALALGPNINAGMPDAAVPEAYSALQKAVQLSKKVSEAERAYIEALKARYVKEPTVNRAPLDLAYAKEMSFVVKLNPHDMDAATLFAEALMNTTPWDYWQPDGRPKAVTKEIVKTLERVLRTMPDHPGANHYYIHAVEASSTPERAEAAADRLRTLVPGAGHLVHMPAHIYIRIGRYHDASMVNELAAKADELYFSDSKTQGLYPALYYPHNIHFLWHAASFEGRSEVAINAARKLVVTVPIEAAQQVPGLELFFPTPLFALTQFGKWDEVLTEPCPLEKFKFHLAMWHYSRGLAWAGKQDATKLAEEHEALQQLAKSEEFTILESGAAAFPARKLIDIADHILAGEQARLSNQPEQMIQHFESAVTMEDSLSYMEPPYWYVPVRQFLGAALLEAGKPKQAQRVYEIDLKTHPHNGWSLFGLVQSHEAQKNTRRAEKARKRFNQSWGKADVTLHASRF